MTNYQATLTDILDDSYFQLSDISPSKWAEKNRYMDSTMSRYEGKFSYDITPYTKGIVDCLSPDHPSKIIACMKGGQNAFTAGVVENGIGWIISESPATTLLLTGHSDLSEEAMGRIDNMIDSSGLRHLIRPNVKRKRSMKTGDTNMRKEFPGGSLIAGSAGNHKLLRQRSIRYAFIDDFEAAKKASKEAGETRGLIEQRLAAYGDSMKLFYISTPELKHSSNIEPVYLLGNQNRYHVPCPNCGDYIVLEWRIEKDKEKFGIYYKLNKGNLVEKSVGYRCQSCGEVFKETHKYDMNLAGHWKPTAEPLNDDYWSFHISSLYAPPGMYNWTRYVYQYLEACPPGGNIQIDKYKTFINLCLGKTWEEKGRSPKINQLAQNTRDYPIGVIPDDLSMQDKNGPICLITVAADLNGKEEDARLDYEIIAWSQTGASYSIDHGSIGTFIPRENTRKVKVDRERWTYIPGNDRNVWEPFIKILNTPLFGQDGNAQYAVQCLALDTGNHTHYAYDFLERCHLEVEKVFSFGIKGQSVFTYQKTDVSRRYYGKAKERSDLYMVQVNYIKDELAGKINMKWDATDGTRQPVGFLNFPTPSEGKYTVKDYFIQYESERKMPKEDSQGNEIAYIWEKKNAGVINTWWDTRVYSEAAKEIVTDALCKESGLEPSWRNYCSIFV